MDLYQVCRYGVTVTPNLSWGEAVAEALWAVEGELFPLCQEEIVHVKEDLSKGLSVFGWMVCRDYDAEEEVETKEYKL
jgi:hypothetical protein